MIKEINLSNIRYSNVLATTGKAQDMRKQNLNARIEKRK